MGTVGSMGYIEIGVRCGHCAKSIVKNYSMGQKIINLIYLIFILCILTFIQKFIK